MDYDNFILNTEGSTPFIIKTLQSEMTVTSDDYGTPVLNTVAHGLPYTPLVIGVWYDSSDNVYRDIANDRPGYPFSMPPLVATCVSDDTNVYFEISDAKYPYLTTTYKFRVALLCPSDYTGDVGVYGSTDNTNFIYNSEFKTQSIYKFGTVTLNPGESIDIQHTLGIVPFCRLWNNDGWLFSGGGYDKTECGGAGEDEVTIDSSKLRIHLPSFFTQPVKYHYMIFNGS